MCLGLPMTVVAVDGDTAVVEGFGRRRVVGTLLAGDVPVGATVLVHLDDAVRVLEPEEIEPLVEALRAMLA